MFESKNGKKYGSAYVAKRHDAAHAEKDQSSKHESAETKSFEAGEQEGSQEGEDNAVVAEHGKALKVTIHHDHEGNKHHVTSQHADGHVHESDHQTAEEAHEEGGRLAQISHISPEETVDQEPKPEDMNVHKSTHEADGFEMPSLDC